MKTDFPIYKQHDSMDCGPTCLRMIAKFYGKTFSLKTLRERCLITKSGVSLLGISDAAESLGFHTLAATLSFEELAKNASLPCIAHWKQSHFVVVYKIKSKRRYFLFSRIRDHWIYVADPFVGKVRYKENEFKKAWISAKVSGEERGVCMFLDPTPEFYLVEDEKIDRGSVSYLTKYLSPYKSLIYQLVVAFIVISVFTLITPFLTQSIIDKGINYKDLTFLTIILIAQLTLTFGTVSVNFIRGWIMLHLSTRINISLISNFLMSLMKLPISFFDNSMTGDIMQRIDDNKRIQNFITATGVNIFFSLANFLVFGVIIAIYNLTVFCVFLGGSIAYVIWVRAFLKYRGELDSRRFAQQSSNQSNLIQLVTGMQEIKLNNCEKQKRWEWERLQAVSFNISVKGLMWGQYQSAGATFINATKNLTITYLVAQSVIKGEMTLGMMLSVQFIIGQLNGPIEAFIGFIQNWQDTSLSLARLSEIQGKETEDSVISDKIYSIASNQPIFLENVSFQYEGVRSPFVLKDINATIPSNKITAIVGTSGSGKTTLLKLLLGFYNPTAGEIRIGSNMLSSIYAKTWRGAIGAVMQDGFIFSDTIAGNIAISDDSVDMDKLNHAARVVNLIEFIDSLPLGFNTKIGNAGSGISEGQKQRILIARVVYKNPDFIFLDEATNSLDSNNELFIMRKMNSFFYNKTVVVVAHRLSTVKNADNIIVLEKGKIVEQGTHSELTIRKGAYYSLVKNQLELGK